MAAYATNIRTEAAARWIKFDCRRSDRNENSLLFVQRGFGLPGGERLACRQIDLAEDVINNVERRFHQKN